MRVVQFGVVDSFLVENLQNLFVQLVEPMVTVGVPMVRANGGVRPGYWWASGSLLRVAGGVGRGTGRWSSGGQGRKGSPSPQMVQAGRCAAGWCQGLMPGVEGALRPVARCRVLGALYWAASHLQLPTVADSGYAGAGQGVHTPIKRPHRGQALALDHRTYNTLHRATRCRGERAFALLTGRWRALRRMTASPRRIGHYVKAALVLLHIEQLRRHTSC